MNDMCYCVGLITSLAQVGDDYLSEVRSMTLLWNLPAPMGFT
jgi:hypothetical protein